VREVSAAFSAAIAEGGVRICEIFDLVLTDGTIYRRTGHDRNITWNAAGDTYTPIVGARGPIRYNSDGQADECEINLGNISGDLADIVGANGLDGAVLTIKRIRWDASYAADEEIQLFVGMPDIGYNSNEISLNFRSIFSSLNINIPSEIYQESCNYTLFDTSCGLTQSDYAYSGTATGGSQMTLIDATAGTLYKVDFDAGDSALPIERGDAITGQAGGGTGVVVQIIYLTSSTGTLWYIEQAGVQFVDDEEIRNAGADAIDVNGTPDEDTTFHLNGELEMTSGDNSGQRRPIQIRSGSTITPKWPFVNDNANGDTYKIYPGCDGTTDTCHYRLHNEEEWEGYATVPRIEEVMF